LNNREQSPAFLQHLPRALLRIAADWIEHDVDVARDFFEALRGVVYRFISPELAQ